MPTYEVTSPEGRRFQIDAPEGATPEQVKSYAQRQFGTQPQSPATPIGTQPQAPEAPTSESVGPLGLRRESGTGQLFFEPTPDLPNPPGYKPGLIERGIDAITPDDLVGSVLGGVRNAAVGLATLPADLMGGPYKDVAEGIRRNVPEFRQGDTAGNIAETLTQYVAPGAKGAQMGVKGLGALLQNPGAILKALVGTTGAAVADAAVTNPNQASTLGDLFHAGPTAISPEDGPIERRVKVGAETFLAEPAVRTLGAALRGGRAVARSIGDLIPPSKSQLERSFAQNLQETVGPENIPQVIENLDAARANTDPGFQPTTGSASGNNALLRLQQSQANQGAVADRLAANEENTAQLLDNVTTDRAPPEAAGQLPTMAQGEKDAALAPANIEVANLNRQLSEMQTQMEGLGQDVRSMGGQKTAASEQIDQTLRDVEQQMTSTKNALYQAADPQGNLRAPAPDLMAALNSLGREEGQLAGAVPYPVISMLQQDIVNGAGTISFRGLVNARATLSEEIAKARMATGNTNAGGPAVANLTRIKEAIDRQIGGFAESMAPEMQQAAMGLQRAQDYYATEFASRFKQGQGSAFRRDVRGRVQAPPSTTAGRFLQMGRGGGSGAREAAQDLNRLLTPAKVPPLGPGPRVRPQNAAQSQAPNPGYTDAEWEYTSKGDLPNPEGRLPAPEQVAGTLPPPGSRAVTAPSSEVAVPGNNAVTDKPGLADSAAGPDIEGARQAARQFILSDMAEKVGSPRGLRGPQLEAWKSRFDQWARNNQDVLAENRPAFEEFRRLRNRASLGGQQVGQIEKDLQAATESLGQTEKDFNQSSVALFLKNENPADAVKAALNGGNPVRTMRQLRAMAAKDTSGQAAEGLRDLVRQNIRNMLTQNAETNSGALLKPSSAQMIRLFEKRPEVAAAIDETLAATAQDVRNLRAVRTQLRQMSRKAQGTSGSITNPLADNEKEAQSLLASVFAATHGLGGLSMAKGRLNIANYIAKLLGRDPQVVMEKMLEDAILDPQYAKMLLLRETPETRPLIERSIRTYVTNNIIGTGPGRQQDNQEAPNEQRNP